MIQIQQTFIRKLNEKARFVLALFCLVFCANGIQACSSCEVPKSSQEAQSYLESQIRKDPRRFLISSMPTRIALTELPAGQDLEQMNGRFYKVELETTKERRGLFVATDGCGIINISMAN